MASQLGEPGFEALARPLQILDGRRVLAFLGRRSGLEFAQLVHLPADEALIGGIRHADAAEGVMGDDDAVPAFGGDAGGKFAALGPAHRLLVGDQDPGAGIGLQELPAELLQHVVGHDEHRPLDQPEPLLLHAGGDHGEGLARADGMVDQRVSAGDDAPDGVQLMRHASGTDDAAAHRLVT